MPYKPFIPQPLITLASLAPLGYCYDSSKNYYCDLYKLPYAMIGSGLLGLVFNLVEKIRFSSYKQDFIKENTYSKLVKDDDGKTYVHKMKPILKDSSVLSELLNLFRPPTITEKLSEYALNYVGLRPNNEKDIFYKLEKIGDIIGYDTLGNIFLIATPVSFLLGALFGGVPGGIIGIGVASLLGISGIGMKLLSSFTSYDEVEITRYDVQESEFDHLNPEHIELLDLPI